MSRIRLLFASLFVAVGAVLVPASPVIGDADGSGSSDPPGFSAVDPVRVVDTRTSGRVGVQSVVVVDVPAVDALDRVAAVVMTVTVVNPAESGFVTVFPCGEARPDASNINYAAGVTRAATVFSKLGVENQVCVYTYAETDILVDVTGVYYDTSTLQPLTPYRLADTRKTLIVDDDSTLVVDVKGRGGVGEDATHVVVTLTAVNASMPGFLTAYACDGDRPDASNVNYFAGDTVANQAVVPLASDGTICVYSYASTNILVDVAGFFVGVDAVAQPTRIADTRSGNADRYTSRNVMPSTWNASTHNGHSDTYRIVMVDASQVGDRASSIYANITVDPVAGAAGFVAPIPCDATSDSDAGSSVVNYSDTTIANAAVLDVNRAGYTCVLVRDYDGNAKDINLIVDVIGWTPAGWDTDGDGIEDTDEQPGCELLTDCDGDGTLDNEEPSVCADDRSCEHLFEQELELRQEHLVLGNGFTCALQPDLTVACWGTNSTGQLGDGAMRSGPDFEPPCDLCPPPCLIEEFENGCENWLANPVEVNGLPSSISMDSASHSSCAVTTIGRVECWGSISSLGQVSDVPVDIGLEDVASVSIGDFVGCAVHTSGDVSCWGSNFYGMLGTPKGEGDQSYPFVMHPPQQVPGVAGATSVTVGFTDVCVVLTDGTVSCWGSRGNDGGTWSFDGLQGNVVSLSGYESYCALTDSGEVWCSAAHSLTTMEKVPEVTDAISLATNGTDWSSHSCAVTASGNVYCWGDNNEGQLGNGSTDSTETPVKVLDIDSAYSVSVTDGGTCALLTDGTIACWGNNTYGQLRNGTQDASHTPLLVASD